MDVFLGTVKHDSVAEYAIPWLQAGHNLLPES